MCFDNDETSDVWALTTPKARKAYRCYECADGIRVGELYRRIASLYEGRWETIRLCARCVWDHERVFQHELSEGCAEWESRCPVGYLQEHMDNMAQSSDWPKWLPSPITYREAA